MVIQSWKLAVPEHALLFLIVKEATEEQCHCKRSTGTEVTLPVLLELH